jgi:integrase
MGERLRLAAQESLDSCEAAEVNERKKSDTHGSDRRAAEKLKEPYETLVLFLAASGVRIGEALAIRWTDFKNDVLHITRRIYEGDVDTVKSKRSERKLLSGWHDFRHTLSTKLGRLGVHPKVVSDTGWLRGRVWQIKVDAPRSALRVRAQCQSRVANNFLEQSF